MALFIGAQVKPGPPSVLLIAGGTIAVAVIVGSGRRTGSGSISSGPAGTPSRRLLWTAVGVIAVLIAANAVLNLAGVSPWWGLLPTVLAFAVSMTLGRRYDEVLRTELAGKAPPQ